MLSNTFVCNNKVNKHDANKIINVALVVQMKLLKKRLKSASLLMCDTILAFAIRYFSSKFSKSTLCTRCSKRWTVAIRTNRENL